MTPSKAPPISARPRCLACKKWLKPNYNATRTKSDRVRRIYEVEESYIQDVRRPMSEDDYGVKQDAKGRWYREVPIYTTTRRWLGTYGRYKDGLFCGLNCAYQYAVRTARAIAREMARS